MGIMLKNSIENSTDKYALISKEFFKNISQKYRISPIKEINKDNIIQVLSLEELQGICTSKMKSNIDLLNNYKEKNLEYFEKERNFHMDVVSYYKSYHMYGECYGIYLNISKFLNLFLDILQKIFYSYEDAKNFELKIVLEHSRFHYLTEVLSTMYEYEFDIGSYYKLLDFYKKTYGTKKCIEETLANYFINITTSLSETEKEYLYKFTINQIEGYRDCNFINEDNEEENFKLLERTIGYKEMKYSKILRELMYLPLSYYSINNNINLPIYIVNDTNNIKEFMEIKEMIFPRIRK